MTWQLGAVLIATLIAVLICGMFPQCQTAAQTIRDLSFFIVGTVAGLSRADLRRRRRSGRSTDLPREPEYDSNPGQRRVT